MCLSVTYWQSDELAALGGSADLVMWRSLTTMTNVIGRLESQIKRHRARTGGFIARCCWNEADDALKNILIFSLEEVRGQARFLGVNVKTIMKTQACLLTVAVLCAAGISALAQPVITTQPQSQTNAVGTTMTLAVEATGTPPLWYQWRKASGNVTGATNTTLVLKQAHYGRRSRPATRISEIFPRDF
jgi:hypothetical protein